MKPYNKKVINKKITQALIGVTTLGTVLAIPVSIDIQDNNIGIVKDNKVFAADNIKRGDTVEVGNLMPGDIFIASKTRWVVVDKNHTGYPDNSVTIMPEEFLPFKRWYDKYVENPELHIAPEFDNLGSNYWKDSDIRKYLNTTFYNKLSNDVKSSILTTRLENKACPSDGGDIYYTEDKIFLPSLTEMGLESDYCSPIGTNFQSFNTNESRIMKSYLEDMPDCYSNEQYFTRSVADINNYIYGVGIIDTDGRAITGYANSSNVNGDPNRSHVGIRPVLNVKPDLLVQYDGNNSLIKSAKPEFQADKEAPILEVTGNPTSWTNKDVILNASAKDNNKVKSITLPDGKTVSSDKADFIVSKNGAYKFIVEDDAGNKTTKEVVVDKIDKELPLIDINVMGNKMTIAANDSLSGIKEVFYKIDDGEFIKYTGEVTLSQGAHTIEAKAIDNAGNINKLKNKFNIEDGDVENTDKEAPTLEITGNPVDWTNKDIILNVTAKDNKKVKSITLPDGEVVNGDKTTFTISKNGTYKFIVEDEAGNKTTKEVSINKIDKELPIANINVKDDKMTIAASDKLSGIKEIFYKIDNGEFVRYTGEVTLSPGAHKIKVKAIDNAGNMNDQNSTSSEVNVNIEDKGKKDLEDATKAVEKAETTKKEDDIDRAKEKVAKLPNGKDKDDLNSRLDDLEKQIKAEKDAYIKAYNAVKKTKSTLDKEDYEYAKKALEGLNTTIYKNEKAQLQRVLDALKPYIDRKENQNKQEERNQVRNIESLIRKAIATKDPKAIEEAQAAIDTLESSDTKIELQKRLDTTNKISQMDLAIQARDAVEKLDAYLNYSDIVNNLDELKDLYKETEKATNRLDNNSQYKSRMDKTKGYIEVMEILTKYKENAQKNSILASEKEMTELISKANQLSFTTRNKQNIIKEILQFQEQLKELRETTTVPEV
ncbi:hypothetical protein N494_18075 (plasmid) [Clostridium botulinum A2B7 92]|uniref:OmpL47-type beta-barrel domain-containing protein n=1 Tax=Clostridium botulinum TaxID=1491 RepID=UPI0007E2A385|nr:DUF6273 domain-containing protein [Clostridium botulinum]KEI94037.1 hypothetical protein N494_18075 [Clostridium botulinum A2B7 92]